MFAELSQRLKATTPPFFKFLIKFFGGVAALGATLAGLGALEQLPSWWHKDWSLTLILAGTVGAFVAKLPVDWKETSPNDVPDVTPPPQVTIIKDEFDQPKDDSQS